MNDETLTKIAELQGLTLAIVLKLADAAFASGSLSHDDYLEIMESVEGRFEGFSFETFSSILRK